MALLDTTRDTPAPGRVARPDGRAWRWTAGTGVALLVLVTIHMVANHFIVGGTGGLRDYRQVLDYLSHPVIFVTEALMLTTVTIHAMLGVRSILFDLDLRARTRRWIERALWALGTVTVAYGLILLTTLAGRA